MNEAQVKLIQTTCWDRISAIEESSSNGNIPHYAFDLYSLYYFIMVRNFQKYVQNFECQTVEISNITQAKSYYNWPPVSVFERDVVTLLNELVDGKMKKDRELGSNLTPAVVNSSAPIRLNNGFGER